ncbi:MAG: hypothetical protein J0G30_01580 [Actinomycetales bacterium]|nr:hypothetical protein [Actinomycetales bacterium]
MTQQLKTMQSGLTVVEHMRHVDLVTIGEVRELLDCSRPSAYRMVATLVDGGYLLRARGRAGYVAGPTLLNAFDATILASPLRPLIRSFLYRMRDLTEASVHCSTLVGASAFALDGYRSRVDLHLGGRVGMSAPAHVMAAGKLLLSQLDAAQVHALFPDDALPEWRSARVRTRAMLDAELNVVRSAGYAMANEESEATVVSVALPFTGIHSRNRTALVLSRSTPEVQIGDLLELLPIVSGHLGEFLRDHQDEFAADGQLERIPADAHL